MTLFDVDTNNNIRQSASPNKIDQISADARMAHGTSSITLKTPADPSLRRLVTRDAQHLANDGDVNVAIYGFLPDGTAGLWVAKPGVEVTNATPANLIFNSGQNVFKIDETLTGTIAIGFASNVGGALDETLVTNSTNSLSLAHGLDHVPAIVVFMYDSTGYVPITNGSFLQSIGFTTTNPSVAFQGTTVGGVATMYWNISVDATNVTIAGRRAGFVRAGVTIPATTFPLASLKVYCLQETAS